MERIVFVEDDYEELGIFESETSGRCDLVREGFEDEMEIACGYFTAEELQQYLHLASYHCLVKLLESFS